MRFPKLSIGGRIQLLTILAAAGAAAVLVIGSLQLNSTMRSDVATKTQHVVETAHALIAYYHAEEQAGRLSRDEAQTAAKAAIASLNYDGSEYFWINDMHPRMVMHPNQTELNGADLSANTAPFVPEFDAVAALDYHLDNGFSARVEIVALGEVTFDDFNRTPFRESAYVLLNSAVGFRKDQWSVALYGSNLADKEYYTNMNPEISTGAVGIPREYGVRVGMEF